MLNLRESHFVGPVDATNSNRAFDAALNRLEKLERESQWNPVDRCGIEQVRQLFLTLENQSESPLTSSRDSSKKICAPKCYGAEQLRHPVAVNWRTARRIDYSFGRAIPHARECQTLPVGKGIREGE